MQTQIVRRFNCSNTDAVTKLSEAVEQINKEGYIVTQIMPSDFYENDRPYKFALLCTLYQR